MSKFNCKNLTNLELSICFKLLPKVIKVENGKSIFVNKNCEKLPKYVCDYIFSSKLKDNPFFIADIIGNISEEMSNRFIKIIDCKPINGTKYLLIEKK